MIEEIYKNTPKEVKKLIDSINKNNSYKNLEIISKKLLKLGYYMNYGLDGEIEEFYKIGGFK